MTTFKFFETEREARDFCAGMDRRSKAHFTPWGSDDPRERMHFIAWYETAPQRVRYEIRQVDALMQDDESWYYNETWHLGEFATASADVPRAFRRALANIGVTFYRGRTRTEYDGDVYEITDRRTGEPLFVAIPQD